MAIKVGVGETDGLVALDWGTSMAQGVNGTSDTPGALTPLTVMIVMQMVTCLKHTHIHTHTERI